MQEVDKLNYTFCKIILGVRPQTSNAAVLGEVGRFLLSLIARQRAVKYWTKVLQNPNSLIYDVYNKQRDLFISSTATQNTAYQFWCSSMKSLLNNLEYGNIFDDPNAVNMCTYVSLMQRLRDQYIQE